MADKKAVILQVRERARLGREELRQEKTSVNKLEKSSAGQVIEERKKQVLASKKAQANRVYRERYANAEEAAGVEQEPDLAALFPLGHSGHKP